MDTTKQILKPSKVNEFEFIVSKRINEEYVTDNALISVKINNAVKEIKFFMDWNSEKSNFINSKFLDESFEKSLKELGIELDLTVLYEEYKSLLEAKKENDRKVKLEKAKKAYDKCWIHNVKKLIDNLQESGIKTSVESFNEDNFLRGYRVIVEYKNNKIYVSEHYVSNSKWSMDSHFAGYSFNDSISDYKTKRFTKLESLISSFKKLVDDKIAKEKEKKKEEVDNLKNIDSTKTKLEEILNITVEHKKEYKLNPYYRGRRHERSGYEIDEYSITIKDQKIKVDLIKPVEEDKLDYEISINGLKVNIEQAKEIIKILEK